MKKTCEVTILNQKFLLKTENNEEHVRKVADYVNRLFEDIQLRAHNVSTQNMAILGALNIAEEMFLKDEQTKFLVSQWKSRLETLLTQGS